MERDERDANGANFRPRIDFLSEFSRRHRVARTRVSRERPFSELHVSLAQRPLFKGGCLIALVCDRSCANEPPPSHPLVRSAVQSGSEVARTFFKNLLLEFALRRIAIVSMSRGVNNPLKTKGYFFTELSSTKLHAYGNIEKTYFLYLTSSMLNFDRILILEIIIEILNIYKEQKEIFK